jgi:hypothetical protein
MSVAIEFHASRLLISSYKQNERRGRQAHSQNTHRRAKRELRSLPSGEIGVGKESEKNQI